MDGVIPLSLSIFILMFLPKDGTLWSNLIRTKIKSESRPFKKIPSGMLHLRNRIICSLISRFRTHKDVAESEENRNYR